MTIAEEQFGFMCHRIPFREGTMNLYVSSRNGEFTRKKPLFLHTVSFGPVPIYRKTESGTSNCLFVAPDLLNDDYHYAVITYPGVPFIANGELQENAAYIDAADLWSFAAANSTAIDFLYGQPWADSRKIVVCGASSGADIAAKVAAINGKVTHVGCFAGCGLTQMHNFVTHVRKKVRAGVLNEADGEREISDLYDSFRAIVSSPDSKDKQWGGHTYKLWYSFFSEPPVENLLRLSIPIYYAKGTEDTSSGIEGTDIIPLEFIRHGKTNLTYKVWWGCDHSFNRIIRGTRGEITKQYLHDRVVVEFMDWLKIQPTR